MSLSIVVRKCTMTRRRWRRALLHLLDFDVSSVDMPHDGGMPLGLLLQEVGNGLALLQVVVTLPTCRVLLEGVFLASRKNDNLRIVLELDTLLARRRGLDSANLLQVDIALNRRNVATAALHSLLQRCLGLGFVSLGFGLWLCL